MDLVLAPPLVLCRVRAGLSRLGGTRPAPHLGLSRLGGTRPVLRLPGGGGGRWLGAVRWDCCCCCWWRVRAGWSMEMVLCPKRLAAGGGLSLALGAIAGCMLARGR